MKPTKPRKVYLYIAAILLYGMDWKSGEVLQWCDLFYVLTRLGHHVEVMCVCGGGGTHAGGMPRQSGRSASQKKLATVTTLAPRCTAQVAISKKRGMHELVFGQHDLIFTE